MKIQFECECGEQISDFTRGSESEITKRVKCDTCGSVYAITITPLNEKTA